MELRTHLGRLAWLDAARRMLAGKALEWEAAIAKLGASDAAMLNAREATEVFGGYGFINDTQLGRFYRDAKILEVSVAGQVGKKRQDDAEELRRVLDARIPEHPGASLSSGWCAILSRRWMAGASGPRPCATPAIRA